MNKKLMFSSDNTEMETPPEVFNPLNYAFKFTVDVAATKKNALCVRYFDIKKDALKQKWIGRCFMNPPYGRQIKHWVEKAYKESQQIYCGCVVGLLPGRIDTAWYQNYVKNKALIIELRGRIFFKFKGKYILDKEGNKLGAPFPSIIAIWIRNDFHRFLLQDHNIS